ncbi:hypothetical protein [Kitasatospora sp. NPDC050543]|uniref:hypothetical protein n=1 Tax=Kitasatospora sp. NPDC050543 TaxID=3364054 RepID=UPI0037B4A651
MSSEVPQPRSPGRVSVALYIAAADGDPGGELANHCRQYADAREWVIAASFSDAGLFGDLDERPGWQGVTALLPAGRASGIVTWTRSMVAHTPEAWKHLTELIADRGSFLASGSLDTPGQRLYTGGVHRLPPSRPRRGRSPGPADDPL